MVNRGRVLLISELRAEALELYSKGHGYRTVAELMYRPLEVVEVTLPDGSTGFEEIPERKVSHMWVKRAVDRELAMLAAKSRDAVEKRRQLQLARSQRLVETFMPAAMRGDKDAAVLVFRALDHEAKLFGLFQPVVAEGNLNEGGPSVEISKRIAEAREKVAAAEAAMRAGELEAP